MNAYERGKAQGARFLRNAVRLDYDWFEYFGLQAAERRYKTFAKAEEFTRGWCSNWPGMSEYAEGDEQADDNQPF